MTSISPIAIKRLQKDLAQLRKNPLILANAEPKDDDLSIWNGVILVKLNDQLVPFHFIIAFPNDYPNSAPNVGFSSQFPYTNGASYVDQDKKSKCYNKFILCLDLLGNFGNIHTEWKGTIGSGWSPAYNVSTLLINLQAMLLDLDTQIKSKSEKQRVIDRMNKFAKNHPDLIPECLIEEPKKQVNHLEKLDARGRKLAADLDIVNSPEKLKILVEFLQERPMVRAENSPESFEIQEVSVENVPNSEIKSPTPEPVIEPVPELAPEPKIDENIVCYATGCNYTEDILGYGISAVHTGRQINLSTPAELLSKTAFTDYNINRSTTKQPFQYFLPAFINPEHSFKNPDWVGYLKKCLIQIGKQVYGKNSDQLADIAIEVYARLINTLCVEMMNDFNQNHHRMKENHLLADLYDRFFEGEISYEEFLEKQNQMEAEKGRNNKSPALAYFECINNLWRTFHWLANGPLKLINEMNSEAILKFVKNPFNRHKSKVADLGAFLVCYSISFPLARRQNSKITHQYFIEQFLEETFIRQVRFFQDQYVYYDPTFDKKLDKFKFDVKMTYQEIEDASFCPPNIPRIPYLDEIFTATKTSRDNILFQIFFLRYVIGGHQGKFVKNLDTSNCKTPEILENLQANWKKYQIGIEKISFQKVKGEALWKSYFSFIGINDLIDKFQVLTFNQTGKSVWILKNIKKAHSKGVAYGAAKRY